LIAWDNTAMIWARALPAVRVSTLIDMAQAQQDHLGLVLRQHQRRKIQAWPQDIADAGLALDRRALLRQF
jgi:hypothetical protein